MSLSDDLRLFDEVLTGSLNLLRFSAGEQAKIVAILKELERELIARLGSVELGPSNRLNTERVLATLKGVIEQYYERAAAVTDLTAVAQAVAAQTSSAIGAIKLNPNMPSAEVIEQLMSEMMIQGSPAKAWWDRQAQDTVFRFSAAIRQGAMAGESLRDLSYRVVGKRGGDPGVMLTSRRNATTLANTAIQTVANEARLKTFEANDDIIKALKWVTALDGHVCPLCAARADLSWTLTKRPIGHSIPFANPGLHFNDRCVLVPITKTFRDMGIDIDEPVGQRASSSGPVAGDTTFNEYLKRQGYAFQNEVLGPGRADLWRKGRITLQDLISGTGRPLTLKQLQAL